MEDTKKMDEATKPEEVAERVELSDEQLDEATGGAVWCIIGNSSTKIDPCKGAVQLMGEIINCRPPQ